MEDPLPSGRKVPPSREEGKEELAARKELDASIRAMDTVRRKIVGKKGRRLSTLVVDLEKSAADFEEHKAEVIQQGIEADRRLEQLRSREDTLKKLEASPWSHSPWATYLESI